MLQRMEATRQIVIANLIAVGVCYLQAMEKAKLKVSIKSTFTASDADLETAVLSGIKAQLGRTDVPVTAVAVAEDIGVDRGRGAAGARPRAAKRREANDHVVNASAELDVYLGGRG